MWGAKQGDFVTENTSDSVISYQHTPLQVSSAPLLIINVGATRLSFIAPCGRVNEKMTLHFWARRIKMR